MAAMHLEALKDFAASGGVTLKVSGDCMGEALPGGSEAYIRAKNIYWPGDIVVYTRGNGQLVSHRMLGYLPGRHGWLAMARADDAAAADPVVPTSRIVGQVTEIGDQPMSCSLAWRLRSLVRFITGVGDWLRARCSSPAPALGTTERP